MKSLKKKKTFSLKLKTERTDIFNQIRNIPGISRVNCVASVDGVATLELESNDDEIVSQVISHLVHEGIHILACTPEEPSLRELFEQASW